MRLIAIAMMFWGGIALMISPDKTGGLLVNLGLLTATGFGTLFLIEYLRGFLQGNKDSRSDD